MQAEIIAIGTELLLGQIVDTNSPSVARILSTLDINTYYQTVVGDNPQRILEVLTTANNRADLIITIGGLGPTMDDLTKQIVAEFTQKELIYDQAALDKIVAYHQQTGKVMTENNRLQALYLSDSQVIANDEGFAVGCFYNNPNGADVLLLPGPPWELEPMLVNRVLPILTDAYKHDGVLLSRVLRFYGIGESRLATQLAPIINKQSNPTVAPYAKQHEVTLRITAHSVTKDTAIKLINQMEAEILAEVGDYFYGYGDNYSLTQCVGDLLLTTKTTISAAESLTAGLFQSTLANIEGISQVFKGGFITYDSQVKSQLLDVDSALIEQYGVVSEQVAVMMAKNTKKILQTDLAISFTGVASGELENKPAGTVWIGIAYRDQPVQAYLYHFGKNRQANRQRAVMAGLDLIRRTILGLPSIQLK